MLASDLPSGTDVISFRNTLFRVSELCWIKSMRLTLVEIGLRVLSIILAVAWLFAMASSKGTFQNVEFLLGLLPIVLAWHTSGSLRIGCTGDFEDSYDSRQGANGALFRSWIKTLRSKEPDWIYLEGKNYEYLLNPHRISWIRPCYEWKLFPLLVAGTFYGYLSVLNLGLNLRGYPVIDDFQILIFENSVGTLRLLCYLVVVLALACFAFSIKRSVEICGTGGVQDSFSMSLDDQDRLIGLISGKAGAAPISKPDKKGRKPSAGSIEVAVAKVESLAVDPAGLPSSCSQQETVSATSDLDPKKNPEARDKNPS